MQNKFEQDTLKTLSCPKVNVNADADVDADADDAELQLR